MSLIKISTDSASLYDSWEFLVAQSSKMGTVTKGFDTTLSARMPEN